MTFGSVFGRTFSPTFQPSSQAAAGGGWWDLNGTITSCVAAYQPKGAASYAASKVNLANAGTYDATDGAAYPAWDETNGWKFTATSSHYLTTGVTPSQTWSMIVRFSNVTNSTCLLCGCYYGQQFYLSPNISSKVYYGIGAAVGGEIGVSPAMTSGILAKANNLGYRNGSFDNATGTGTATPVEVYIGAGKHATNGSAGLFVSAYIQAWAIYNETLTSTQIGNLTTAMAAL